MLTHGTISRIKSPYVILQPYCKIECEPHVCAFSIHVKSIDLCRKEAYSELCQTSWMEDFAKLAQGF